MSFLAKNLAESESNLLRLRKLFSASSWDSDTFFDSNFLSRMFVSWDTVDLNFELKVEPRIPEQM